MIMLRKSILAYKKINRDGLYDEAIDKEQKLYNDILGSYVSQPAADNLPLAA